MNCQQVEDLLPLYVSRDLDEQREGSIAAHLRSCIQCGGAAEEYSEARQQLQEFSAPAFSEDVYDQIRRNVWREIEREPAAPSIAEVIAGWFRPRLTWAVATAVLVIVSVLGIYFIANRDHGRTEVAGDNREVKPPAPIEKPGPQPTQEKLADVSSPPDDGKQERRQGIHHERRSDRRRAPDRGNTLVVNVPDPLPGSSPVKGVTAESMARSTEEQPRPLRMEIQTKNPNIRIIWFAQRDPKPVSPNSKGT